MIFLISAFQAAKIIGISHQNVATKIFLNILFLCFCLECFSPCINYILNQGFFFYFFHGIGILLHIWKSFATQRGLKFPQYYFYFIFNM
jgi:cytochrome c oxidase subunit IV